MISQLFILSGRGDVIVNRDFRDHLAQGINEIFMRKSKLIRGDLPPVFQEDGVNFIHIKRNGLYVLSTTHRNVSASFVCELLQKLVSSIKDFCGIFSEDAIRKNFIFVYEIIEEMIDYGYPQSTNTDMISPYLVNEPIIVDESFNRIRPPLILANTLPSTASNRPVSAQTRKNEIFVDVYERLSFLFNSSGFILNSSMNGAIYMKSYLQNHPEINVAFNENLVLGKGNNNHGTFISDWTFSECVNYTEFETQKLLKLTPPNGEFALMNYQIIGDYEAPFSITPYLDLFSFKAELKITVRASISNKNYAANLSLKVNLPKAATYVAFDQAKDLSGQTANFSANDKFAEWNVKKFPGNSEHSVTLRVTLAENASAKEFGPISLTFEIPAHNMSNLEIRYLRMADSSLPEPTKWVRYITQSSSYVRRL